MVDLIRRGHVYIAQPPLYRIKKGKFEQYIKDDREFVKVMIKRASEGMGLRYGSQGKKLEGGALTRFMGQLNDYLSVFEKANKHLRNEEVTELLPKFELMKRADFESEGKVPAKLARLHAELQTMTKRFQFKAVAAPRYEEEHRTWSVSFTDSQGAERRIDWTLASSPEFRQMMAKYSLIREELEGPYVIEYAKAAESEEPEAEAPAPAAPEAGAAKAKKAKRAVPEPVSKQSARDVFEYVIEAGRRDYDVQRYKGLGEMTSTQLWETTMDPDRRTLLSVKLEDIAETESIFSTLMGEDVEARRKFIEDNALDVKNLDI
jgi:DNA gyrase subunit B